MCLTFEEIKENTKDYQSASFIHTCFRNHVNPQLGDISGKLYAQNPLLVIAEDHSRDPLMSERGEQAEMGQSPRLQLCRVAGHSMSLLEEHDLYGTIFHHTSGGRWKDHQWTLSQQLEGGL